jgi:hypothetical protein
MGNFTFITPIHPHNVSNFVQLLNNAHFIRKVALPLSVLTSATAGVVKKNDVFGQK